MKHNSNLDILRGLAALLVFLFHFNGSKDFDPIFSSKFSLYYNFPGGLAVLVFFILSGYVIGLTTPVLTSGPLIRKYLVKRAVRIMPIYIVVILFTAYLGNYSFGTVLSNLLFLNIPLCNLMNDAGPIWSLHFEVLFYLLFVPISLFRISLGKIVTGLLATIIILFVFFHNVNIPPLIISYLVGLLFWISGTWIAGLKSLPRWNISGFRIMAVFLLMFSLQSFNPYGLLVKSLNFTMIQYSNPWYHFRIFYFTMYFYPFVVLLILSAARLYTRWNVYLYYFLIATASLRLLLILKMYGIRYAFDNHYTIPVFFLFLSIFLWLINKDFSLGISKVLKSTAWLSNISYALYVVHVPLIFVFGGIACGSSFIYSIKVVAYLVVLFGVSYLLEMKYQPFIRKKINGKVV